MRSARLLAVAVLAVVLAVSSVQNAFAATELKYDDGTAEDYFYLSTGGVAAVRFSLPTGWSSAKLLTAEYYIYYYSGIAFRVRIFNSGGVTELLLPPLDVTPSATGCVQCWFSVDLGSYNIVVSGDFYVAIEWKSDALPWIGRDTSSSAGPSYMVGLVGWEQLGFNLMVRAVVDEVTQPEPAPVGGFVESVNTFALLSPWVAVIGLVGCIGTVVVVAKKRR